MRVMNGAPGVQGLEAANQKRGACREDFLLVRGVCAVHFSRFPLTAKFQVELGPLHDISH